MDAKKNRHFERILGKTVVTVVLIICGISCLLPLAWMISTSFKPELDVFEYPIRWIPKRWNFNTYKTVFTDDLFPIYFLNSAKVTFFSVVGNVFFSALAGYAFARLRFKGRNVLFIIYLATMMVPNQVLLVPKYLLFQTLHMSNTHYALILPAMFEVFSVFLMRQAFMSVPRSLSEAAIIDGASQFRVFGQIILPQIKPTLLTVTLLQFTSSWNDYINPKTYLSRDFMYTIPVGLQKFQMSNGSSYSTILQRLANNPNKQMIEKACAIIYHQYAESSFSLNAVADEINISYGYLCTIFKQVTGEKFMDYLLRVRMQNAKRLLLEGGHKIYEIAQQTGYNSARYFTLTFRKYYGMTPSEYTKKYGGKNEKI